MPNGIKDNIWAALKQGDLKGAANAYVDGIKDGITEIKGEQPVKTEIWNNLKEGNFRGAANAYVDGIKQGFNKLRGSDIVQENVETAAPFWGAVAEGDFKGAANAYKDNITNGLEEVSNMGVVQNYMETNKPMIDAVKEHGLLKGTLKGYQAQLDAVMSDFRDNCGEHVPDACEVYAEPPSCGVDTSHVQAKQNDDMRR